MTVAVQWRELVYSAVSMQLKGFSRQVLGGKAMHAYIDAFFLIN